MDGTTAPRSGPAPALDASSAFVLLVTIIGFFIPLLLYFPPVPPSKRDALLETHSPVGLKPSESKLQNVYQHQRGHEPNGTLQRDTTPKIRSLWIYPLKSCKGIEVRQSKVLPTGLEYDRLYTFAQLKSPFPAAVQPSSSPPSSASASPPTDEKDSHSWHFITQRQFPLLATVQVELFVPDIIKARGQPFKLPDPYLLVRFPWREPGLLRGSLSWLAAKLSGGWSAQPEKQFVLPVAFPTEDEIRDRGYTREEVTVWRDTVTALNLSAELPRELQLYLGVSNRLGLFRLDPARLRQVFRCAPRREEAGYQPVTGFQDAYPLHLLNLTSVRDLDAKIEKDDDLRELDPKRFRANIILDGGDTPYDEETWKKIRLSPAPGSKRDASAFHVSCRTVRCKLPNVDQETGHRHPVEPDRSLRKYREVDEGAKLMGCLGMQLTPLFSKTGSPEDMESWLEVGMSVDVLERGDHQYIRQ